MDRWEILILNLISHVNPGNEQFLQGCIRVHLQQPLSRLYWIKTQHSWLSKNPIIEFLVEIHFRLQISLKANQSNLPKSLICLANAHMEDTISYNIAQMTSASMVYIPFPSSYHYNWCHIITSNRRQHRYGSR